MPIPFYLNMPYYQEAVASIALSHPNACPCMICRAADGDDEAMLEIIQKVFGDKEVQGDPGA